MCDAKIELKNMVSVDGIDFTGCKLENEDFSGKKFNNCVFEGNY